MLRQHFENATQKILLSGILMGIGLIALGWILIPTAAVVSILAGFLVFILYGLAIYFFFGCLNHAVLRFVRSFGLLAGIIFSVEIILEYLLLPKNNAGLGLWEFGLAFGLYFLAAVVTSYQTKSINYGIQAAVGSAMVSSLLWAIVVLTVFYLFRNTPQQMQVFQAEGNYTDFAQSGMTDFNAFILEDFMGAIFFHSILVPILSSILGAIGGTIGKLVGRVYKR